MQYKEVVECCECKYAVHGGAGDSYICVVSPEERSEHKGDFYCSYGVSKIKDGADDLRPCPFCGSHPALIGEDHKWYHVECQNGRCGCLPSTWLFDTPEEAIEAWNHRVPVIDEYEVRE